MSIVALVRNSLNVIPKGRFFLLQKSRISVGKPALDKSDPAMVEVIFVQANGSRIKAKGKIGDSLLDVVINNDIDFDGFGSCGGNVTCSTCHLILKKEDYDRLPNPPVIEEDDMLDLAVDVTETSRLGCQIHLTEDLNGLEVMVPANTSDARS